MKLTTCSQENAKAVRAVAFRYESTCQTTELLETFRLMVNHAIDICLKEGIKGRLNLRNRIYTEFQERYHVVSVFPYSVAEVAWSIVKKHRRWQRRPYARHLMMKMEAGNYSLNYGIISLPFKKGERVLVPLEYGDYQRSFLMDETLKRGSVTVTEREITIAFSREATTTIPLGRVGIDLNEKSAVCSDGSSYDLSEVARLHTEYGVRRGEFYRRHPNDRRLKQKFAGSRREKERVKQFLHVKAKEIVRAAKRKGQALVLERLKGVRYSHQRGNWEGNGRRRRISQWPFRMLQAFIVYKAAWKGVPVEFVSAAYTSQTCHECNFVNRRLKPTDRSWQCPTCGCRLERDLNAAINIERRGKIACLPTVRAGARGMDEAMKGNEQTAAPLLRAEAPKPGS